MLLSAGKTAQRLLSARNLKPSSLAQPGRFIRANSQKSAIKKYGVGLAATTGVALAGSSLYLRFSPNAKFKALQSLPFLGALFDSHFDKGKGGEDESKTSNELEETSNSAVKTILKLNPTERLEAANNMLTELTSNLGLSVLAAVATNSLAARSIGEFSEDMARFSKDLTNSTSHDSESDKAVLQLLEKDRDLQITLIKAQKSTLEAKEKMNLLEKILSDLCCSNIPLSENVIENTEKSLQEAQIELKKAEDFLSLSVNSSGPPEALLSRVIRMTADMEEDLGFSLTGLCSKETRELYNYALANYIQNLRSKTEKELNDLNKRSMELKTVLGKEGEQKRLEALIRNREDELRSKLTDENHFQLNQIKKKLEQHIIEDKKACLAKTSRDHQSVLLGRKFAFERELKEQTEKIKSDIENWKKDISRDLEELGPNTKRHELNIQKLSDAFAFANTCSLLNSALTTDPFPQLDWKHQVQPIKQYLLQIAYNNEANRNIVQAVLATIPDIATNRGVFTENSLKQRFREVEPQARKVSFLKSNEKNSLVMYILSYIRSMMLVKPVGCISKLEKSNEPADLSQFTNEDLLDRAKYFMDRGDIMQAARYINMLQGAAQHVTSGWVEEVLLHLQVAQAASTLSAVSTLLIDHYEKHVGKLN